MPGARSAFPDAGTGADANRHTGGERRPRIPVPATILTRIYKGETLQVKVLPVGFEYEGVVYKSLSAVAKKITGTHCNGYLFFHLTKEGGDQ